MTFSLKHIQDFFEALVPGKGGALLFAEPLVTCNL